MNTPNGYTAALARMTVTQRLRAAAVEMRNLRDLTTAEPWLNSILEHIEDREYQTAIDKVDNNWEPRDQYEGDGTFAENH